MENRISGWPAGIDPSQYEEQLRQQLRDAQRQLTQHWLPTIQSKIVENPAASLGAALAVGVMIGWLLKRR